MFILSDVNYVFYLKNLKLMVEKWNKISSVNYTTQHIYNICNYSKPYEWFKIEAIGLKLKSLAKKKRDHPLPFIMNGATPNHLQFKPIKTYIFQQ